MASVNHIVTQSRYEILREVVKDYPGLLSAAEPLIRELDRHTKNWSSIVGEIRTYALKNFHLHDNHEKGVEAIRIILDVFHEASDSPDASVQQSAIDSLMFYLEKILMDGSQDLSKYASIFRDCFKRLGELDEQRFFFLITNPHQLNKLGRIILGKTITQFDIQGFNSLLFSTLLTTYEYWLGREDPVKWLAGNTAANLNEEERTKIEESIYPVSHANLKQLILHLESLKEIADQHLFLEKLLKLPGYMQLV